MGLAHVFTRDGFFIDEMAHPLAQGVKLMGWQAGAQIGRDGAGHGSGVMSE
jgi:hypothetical protein